MPETERTSLMLRTDQKEMLREMSESDDPRWDSMSDAAQHLIDRGEEADDLETDIERLQNEKEVLTTRLQEVTETPDTTDIVPDDGDDDSTIFGRLKWLLRG